MQWKYTPKFQEAYDRVLAVGEAEGEEALRRAFRDEMLKLGHEERVRNLYRIKDKLTSKPIQFAPNAGQEFYLTTKKGRDIILKPRQVGYTTLASVEGLDLPLWESNMSTGIMAHHQGTVGTIFTDLVKFTYNWFVRDWGHLYNPTQKNDNATELAFKDDGLGRILDSSIRVLYDFRGKTINKLHVSEASRVEDSRLLGSLQGVPANGEVVLESTANGRGGNFYDRWQDWRNFGQSAPYKGHFIPWFAIYPEVPENWVPEVGTEYTEYEQNLMEAHELQPHHILWRRWCILANCNGDPDQFEAEYPSNDQDCFLAGVLGVFPFTIIKAQERNTRDPQKVGFLMSEGNKVTVHEDPKGTTFIWKMPDPGRTYVIGADPSGGVGKDKGAAYVKDRKSKETVAAIWGDIEPADLAKELYKLGFLYNKAWINVEVNNHGHTVIQGLKERNYPNLYKRQVLDEMTSKLTTKIGFLTTNESKLRITEQLKTALKDGDLILLHKAAINELSTFVQVASKTGRGIRREAAQGAHDDLVIALALCQEMDCSRGSTDFATEVPQADAMRDAIFDPITGMPN
jgi:hypothetical protein